MRTRAEPVAALAVLDEVVVVGEPASRARVKPAAHGRPSLVSVWRMAGKHLLTYLLTYLRTHVLTYLPYLTLPYLTLFTYLLTDLLTYLLTY